MALTRQLLTDGTTTQEQLYNLGWTKEVKCHLCQYKCTGSAPDVRVQRMEEFERGDD